MVEKACSHQKGANERKTYRRETSELKTGIQNILSFRWLAFCRSDRLSSLDFIWTENLARWRWWWNEIVSEYSASCAHALVRDRRQWARAT
jgi:hypothetical protein